LAPRISLHWTEGGETVAKNIRISKRTIDGLTPEAKPYKRFDDTVKGFGVRTTPSGSKFFFLEYRAGGGGRAATHKSLPLGRFGEITAEQARAKALHALARVRLGDDPQAEKARQRAALTVSDLIDAYLETHVAKLKPKSQRSYSDALAKVRAAHGSIKADAMTRQQIARLHTSLASTPYVGNRVLAVVSGLYAWAEDHGFVPEGHPNPARKVTRYREQARERFLTSDELARLADALRQGETTGLRYPVDETKPNAKHARKPENRRETIDVFAAAAIRLLILTGARLREVLHAQWSQLDIQRGALFLPDSKSGAKPIYLNAAALSVLASLPRLHGNPYLIPGSIEGRPRVSLDAPWQALTRAAGLEGVRIHDLRHTHASIGVVASLGLPIVGKLLGHSHAATTQRYAHLAGDGDPIRRAVETIGAVLDGAMNRSSGKVIKITGNRV
jgi:integrase